ncbi:MAG TPA: helix-turn-helix domain-containing protein, partial [Pseudonocardiaceae bacterium]|nr:helix-turn-helix domain-containing protein [Pseudonocardiaceae bacterium]
MPRRAEVRAIHDETTQVEAAGEESGTGVKSARRTIDLLETFAANPAWTSLADLHVRTGFPRSSLH